MATRFGFKLFGSEIILEQEEISAGESSVSGTAHLSPSIVINNEPEPIDPAVIGLWPEFSPQLRDVLLSLRVSKDNKPVHVFTKKLFKSDVRSDLNRLTIPRKRIQAKFLDDKQEDSISRNKKLDVKVIDPSLMVHEMKLNRWNYKIQSSGKKQSAITTSMRYSYALINNWMKIVDYNGFCVGDMVQIWSFQFDGDGVGFFLVKEAQEVTFVSSDGNGGCTIPSRGRKRKRGSKAAGVN